MVRHFTVYLIRVKKEMGEKMTRIVYEVLNYKLEP